MLEVAWCSRASTQRRRDAVWQPFFDWRRERRRRLRARSAPLVIVAAAGAAFLGRRLPEGERAGLRAERRPARRAGGQRLLARQPAARPASSCMATSRPGCRRALLSRPTSARAGRCAVRRHRATGASSLHFNKGLAGAPAEAIAAARDTATNPAVLDAFALAISAAEGAAGLPRHCRPRARRRAGAPQCQAHRRARWTSCEAGARTAAPTSRRANYFEPDWQQRLLGRELSRGCAQVKDKYDPTACSSSTTASAARTGAPTVSRA